MYSFACPAHFVAVCSTCVEDSPGDILILIGVRSGGARHMHRGFSGVFSLLDLL